MRYQLKPKFVEAVQFKRAKDIKQFCPNATPIYDGNRIVFFVLDGSAWGNDKMRVYPDHFVIKDENGSVTAMTSHEFHKTYELVNIKRKSNAKNR